MKTLERKPLTLAAIAIDLQLFATTGTTVETNPGAPRRNGTRDPIAWYIDLAVTPSTGPVSGQAGGIGAHELVYMVSNTAGIAGLSTPGTSNANAANCVGISNGQYPFLLTDGVYVGEAASSVQGGQPLMDVYEEGDWLMNCTASQSLSMLTVLYLGADGRTVSTTATGTKVGYVSPDQRQRGGVGLGGFSVAPPTFAISTVAGSTAYMRIQPALTNANG